MWPADSFWRSNRLKYRSLPDPIKVGVITTSYPLHDAAMSGNFVMEMVRNLPRDCRATIVTPCGVAPARLAAEATEQVRCFRYAPWSWQILTHGPGGLPAALREHPSARWLLILFLPALLVATLRAAFTSDILHANWSATGVIAGLAGRLTGTPCITTVRGTDVALGERSRLFRGLLRVCGRLNGRLVAVGDGLRERIALLLAWDVSRILLIPNGVDERFFAIPPPAPRVPLQLVTVGSLVPVKGLDTLLEALGRLGVSPDWELTLVGDGPERERLEQVARTLGICTRVHFAGALPPAAIPDVLAEHAVFVLPSMSEGRPNALLEAMASARAIVASAISAVAELVQDDENGLLFPAGDAAALANRLRQLIATPQVIPELGRRARTSVSAMTWSDTGERYALLYRELLQQPS